MSVIWDWDTPKLGYSGDREKCKCTICGQRPSKFPFFAWLCHGDDVDEIIICNGCFIGNNNAISRDFLEMVNPVYFGKGVTGGKKGDMHDILMYWWEECVVFEMGVRSSSEVIANSYTSWLSNNGMDFGYAFDLWEFLLWMGCLSELNGWRNIRLKCERSDGAVVLPIRKPSKNNTDKTSLA